MYGYYGKTKWGNFNISIHYRNAYQCSTDGMHDNIYVGSVMEDKEFLKFLIINDCQLSLSEMAF